MDFRIPTRMLNTDEAARRLHVSRRRVQELVKSGELKAIATDGRSMLITADSVLRASAVQGHSGRPLSSSTAMAALFLISGKPVTWLNPQQRYRIRRLLTNVDPSDLLYRVHRRAVMREFWCPEAYLDDVSGRIRLSGCYAVVAPVFQLQPSNIVEGYVDEALLNVLVSRFHLKEDSAPVRLRLHVLARFPDMPNPSMEKGDQADDVETVLNPMPLAVCAADLAESTDPRERSAGLAMLGRLLRGDDAEIPTPMNSDTD